MAQPVRKLVLHVLALAAMLVVVMPAPVLAQAAEFAGVWQIERPVSGLRTKDRRLPPLLPQARQTYEQHIAARRAGDLTFDKASWCASPGIPRLLLLSDPFEIVVRPRQVAFAFQWDGWVRLVDMVSPSLSVIYPSSMGVSVGRWEGSILVIETTGLTDATQLDTAGLPHGEELRITERLRLLGANRLENRLTIEDPQFYSRPWEAVVTYRRLPGARIKEDVCLDRTRAGEAAIP